MLRRSQRIRTSPITKAQVAQKNTTVARSTIGLDKSLTRASHTNAGTGCQRKMQRGPCCREKLRKASGNGGQTPGTNSKPDVVPPAHSPERAVSEYEPSLQPPTRQSVRENKP